MRLLTVATDREHYGVGKVNDGLTKGGSHAKNDKGTARRTPLGVLDTIELGDWLGIDNANGTDAGGNHSVVFGGGSNQAYSYVFGSSPRFAKSADAAYEAVHQRMLKYMPRSAGVKLPS